MLLMVGFNFSFVYWVLLFFLFFYRCFVGLVSFVLVVLVFFGGFGWVRLVVGGEKGFRCVRE